MSDNTTRNLIGIGVVLLGLCLLAPSEMTALVVPHPPAKKAKKKAKRKK